MLVGGKRFTIKQTGKDEAFVKTSFPSAIVTNALDSLSSFSHCTIRHLQPLQFRSRVQEYLQSYAFSQIKGENRFEASLFVQIGVSPTPLPFVASSHECLATTFVFEPTIGHNQLLPW